MTKSRGRFAVLTAAAVAVILAGCGGSDSPSTAEPVGSTASTKHHPHIPVEGGTTVIETPGSP